MQGTTGQMPEAGERDPLHHTQRMRATMQQIVDHLRDDIGKIDEPQAKAMFETSAEVIGGIITAFEHYETKCEKAWRA